MADFGRCEHGALPDVCFKCARRSGLLLSRKMTERLKPMTDAVDEATRLRAALAEALRENCCDSCVGTGEPTNGLPCMCGGSGKMSDAAQYLRVQLVEALRERDALLALARIVAKEWCGRRRLTDTPCTDPECRQCVAFVLVRRIEGAAGG